MKKILINILYLVSAVILFIVVWAVAAAVNAKPFVLPSPFLVAQNFFALFAQGIFYLALGATLLRALVAFVLSFMLALVLAVLSVINKKVQKFFQPLVSFLRAAPTMAVILVVIVWLPSNYVPALVALLVAFPVTYSAFYAKLSEQTSPLVMCRVFDVRVSDKIRFVLLPSLYPTFRRQFSDTLPLTLKVIIAGEVLAYPTYGIGVQMYSATVSLETATLLAYTFAAVILCFVIEFVVWGVCRLIRRHYGGNI